MLYTPMTKTALRLCFEAHKDQLDRCGMPYVFHPFHLAEQMDSEEEVCVALLPDVVEDADRTLHGRRAAGMSEPVVEAVALMTHDPAVPYMDYVGALAGNPIARKVKLADLRHNMDLARLDEVTDADLKRRKKYVGAYEFLTGESPDAE